MHTCVLCVVVAIVVVEVALCGGCPEQGTIRLQGNKVTDDDDEEDTL